MKILIFGGAAEGRLLAGIVPALGHDVTVQVATELGGTEGLSLQGPNGETGRPGNDRACAGIRPGH